MGNLSNNSQFDFSLLEKIFKIHFDEKVIYFDKNQNDKDTVSFCDERFESIFAVEKHFLNVYRIYDHLKENWHNLKLINISNDEEVKRHINAESEKFYSFGLNENFVKIQDIFLNERTNKKNNLQLIILEEPLDFLTLKDFLFIFMREFNNEQSIVKYLLKIGSK